MTDLAECLSKSCTTGWLDWVHGELWLLPTGMIRRRLSWSESKAHGLAPTVGTPLPQARLAEFDLAALQAAHRTNKVIHFDDVAQARLAQGSTSDVLRFEMRDGTRHKLLWLSKDPAYSILSSVLPVVLDGRFSGASRSRS